MTASTKARTRLAAKTERACHRMLKLNRYTLRSPDWRRMNGKLANYIEPHEEVHRLTVATRPTA